jgi:hypothetical protein
LATSYTPTHVHLVGSIGLGGVDEVFGTVGRALGRRLKRIPDGEPGPRRLWVSFQYPLLRSSPFLRPDPSGALRKTSGFPLLCLAEGVKADEVEFGELGYAREARGSYLDFLAARDRGDVAKGTRFQVCLPTPMSVIYAFCTARDVAAIEPAYEKAMAREVELICRHIPHRDLCIQWDVCHDMIVWDGQPQDQFPLVNASKEDITKRFMRICGGGCRTTSSLVFIFATAISAASISSIRSRRAISSISRRPSCRMSGTRSPISTCRCRRRVPPTNSLCR